MLLVLFVEIFYPSITKNFFGWLKNFVVSFENSFFLSFEKFNILNGYFFEKIMDSLSLSSLIYLINLIGGSVKLMD